MALYDYLGNIITTGGSGGANPIAGKRIALIGDSNTQYNGAEFKTYMEETYGCTFIPLGTAGYAWETQSAEGVNTMDASAVGRVNAIVAKADSSKLITEYDVILFMMGTNCYSLGEITDTSDNVTTLCGAMRYCMEKMCYYGRRIPIGVIIPIRSDGTKGNYELPDRFQVIEQIANEFNVPVLNLYKEGRVIDSSMTPDGNNWYLGDSVHLGDSGVIQLERIIGKWIAYSL